MEFYYRKCIKTILFNWHSDITLHIAALVGHVEYEKGEAEMLISI